MIVFVINYVCKKQQRFCAQQNLGSQICINCTAKTYYYAFGVMQTDVPLKN